MTRREPRLPPVPHPHWIDTESALIRLEDDLRHSSALIGVDIETTLAGQHHCAIALLQVSDGESSWLIDPLEVDAGPLLRLLFSSPALPPIFHDASGDLMVIKRLYGSLPPVVLDTLLASQVLGLASPNLGNLSRDLLGWKLNKSTQQSNWLRRPLTEAQLEYAALDAFVLPYLERSLRRQVADLGLEHPYERACRELLVRLEEYRAPETYPFELKFFRRYKNQAARLRLRRLLDWRTDEANRGKIDVLMGFGNDTLARIALDRPCSLRELDECVALTGRLRDRYGKRVLQVMNG